ncbi:hypothetical protein MD484_g4661, partial [Candolleomyces efflorescens]
MAPRKPRRQTKALPTTVQDHALPTPEEWEKMKTFACFAVTDDDDELHKFMRGSTATVLPHHYPPGADFPEHEYWVVKIREIRGVIHDEDDTNDVWAKVQWYYAPEDVAGVVKSFDTSACSPYERIFSDHFDFVSSESFNETITIPELNDEDIEQKYIRPDVFFTRYTIERQSRRLKTDSVEAVYEALANSWRGGEEECEEEEEEFAERFYWCAAQSPGYGGAFTGLPGITGTPSPSKRSTSPSKRSALKVPDATPGKKRKTVVFEADELSNVPLPQLRFDLDGEYEDEEEEEEEEKDENDAVLLGALESLPQGLVRIAQQPIVRGRLFAKGGVSGNVRVVVKARRLVYELLGGGPEGGDDVGEDEDAEGEVDEEETVAAAAFGEEVEDEDEEDEVEGTLTRSTGSRRRTRSRSRAANTSKKEKKPTPTKAKVATVTPKTNTKNTSKNKGDGWEEVVFGSDTASPGGQPITLENVEVKVKGGKKALPTLVCPNCRSAI